MQHSIFPISVALLTLTIGGCKTIPPSSHDVELSQKPLICESKELCDKMWKKASFWVATNAGYKIQTANDVVIQTYNAPNYSMTWAFQVSREPLEGTKERIWLRPSCGSVPSCQEDRRTLAARFKTYVMN